MKGSFVTLSEDISKRKTLNHKKAASKRTDAEGTCSILGGGGVGINK